MIKIMDTMENKFNFDPYAGIKLYAYLYDLDYVDIEVNVTPHNLIYGELKETDYYNWSRKLEMAAKTSGCKFRDNDDGYEGFFREFTDFFSDLRRFTYTPLISCRGRKPKAA